MKGATWVCAAVLLAGCAAPPEGPGEGASVDDGGSAPGTPIGGSATAQSREAVSVPEPAAPADGARGMDPGSIVLLWARPSSSMGARVYSTVYLDGAQVPHCAMLAGATCTLSGLGEGQRYAWYVHAMSSGGAEATSRTVDFYTNTPPRPAHTLSPAGGVVLVNPGSVALSFTQPADADGDSLRARIQWSNERTGRGGSLSCNRPPCELPVEPGEYSWSVHTSDGKGSAVSAEAAFVVTQTFRIALAPPPSFLPASQAADVRAAAVEGILRWQGYDGWEIRVVGASEPHDAYGEFVREWGGDRLGVAFGSGVMQVGVGDSKCNGQWTRFSRTSVLHIAQHEMGHILGVEHSNDPADVMYPTIPTGYADPCELTSGSATVDAGSYIYWDLTFPSQRALHARLSSPSGDNFRLCVTPGGGSEGCTGKTTAWDDSFGVPAGAVRISIRCENWFYSCGINYRLAESR